MKNNTIMLKTSGFPGLCSFCVFTNLKRGWCPRAPRASHQACMVFCRQSAQVSAGRQQVSNTWGQLLQLLPPSSDHVRIEAVLIGLMLEKGEGELLAEHRCLLRSSFIAASQLCTATFLGQPTGKPSFPLRLPHTT